MDHRDWALAARKRPLEDIACELGLPKCVPTIRRSCRCARPVEKPAYQRTEKQEPYRKKCTRAFLRVEPKQEHREQLVAHHRSHRAAYTFAVWLPAEEPHMIHKADWVVCTLVGWLRRFGMAARLVVERTLSNLLHRIHKAALRNFSYPRTASSPEQPSALLQLA
jgi:hypothetical protein